MKDSLNYDMVKANMLAENIHGFIQYVNRSYQEMNVYLSEPEKLYRLKHLTDEFKLHIIADELIRINRFVYDAKYTAELIEESRKAFAIIGDYIEQNKDDLFIFTSRLYTINSQLQSFSHTENRKFY